MTWKIIQHPRPKSRLGTFDHLKIKTEPQLSKNKIYSIDFKELTKFVGTGVIVPIIGTAVDINIKHRRPDMRQYLMIDLDFPYPRNNISVITFGNYSDQLDKVRKKLLNQKIEVCGKIIDHKMRLHVIVNSLASIKKNI